MIDYPIVQQQQNRNNSQQQQQPQHLIRYNQDNINKYINQYYDNNNNQYDNTTTDITGLVSIKQAIQSSNAATFEQAVIDRVCVYYH